MASKLDHAHNEAADHDASSSYEKEAPTQHIDELQAAQHINLTWRSWMVVIVSCFAIMSQVFVVVAAGSVIAFIIQDLGKPAISGWIIQGPLLMQSVLSPFVGRLSDVLDRKYMAAIPPLIAFVGAVISAKATSMSMLIGGGILIGTTLATIAIVQAIPAEVLPMKYRAIANGMAFMGGAIGGLVGQLGAGALTNQSPSGWRGIFWMQAAFHLATCIGLFVFYHPKRHPDYPRLSLKQLLWEIDPIGSILFVCSTTLLLLALNWAGGSYGWQDPHVLAPLVLGFALLLAFALYEWKGRADGIVAHVFFKGGPNFALATFAFGVEGWIFYSAVNSITPQIVLHLGFEGNAWDISIRQMTYQVPCLVVSIPIMLYATRYKDLKWPLVATYTLFLIVVICYCTIRPTPAWGRAQYGINVISGIGQAGPLTLLVALIQFASPHAYLSTATGLAFSARAIGGAFGSAVLNAVINSKLTSDYAERVGAAAVGAGLPSSSVSALIAALESGEGLTGVAGISDESLGAVTGASQRVYARAYNLAWASVVPFVVLAIVAVLCTRGVKELMTEKVEATVEREREAEREEKKLEGV